MATSTASLLPPHNTTSTPGRDLLRLLRSRDQRSKESTPDDQPAPTTQIDAEISTLLRSLDASLQRRGFLDERRAREIQNRALADPVSGGAIEAGKKKRRRPGGEGTSRPSVAASRYGIHCSESPTADTSDWDEGKLLTALCRMVGVGRRNGEVDDGGTSLKGACEACRVLASICGHAMDRGSGVSGAVVRDMIASIASPLLEAFRCLVSSCSDDFHGRETGDALISSLKAASSVICLVQTRCAQNKKSMGIIQEFRATTWSVLHSMDIHRDADARKAAVVLLASLPLAGDSENTAQTTLWSRSVKEGIVLLQWAIRDLFPVHEKDRKDINRSGDAQANEEEDRCYSTWYQNHDRWMSTLNDSIDERTGNDVVDCHRREKFLMRVQCLTEYLLALMKMKGYPIQPQNTNHDFFGVPFPLQSLLDISETLLSFPLAAEIKHRSLPARLRSTPIDGGFLSPNAALHISASIRYCGHRIFDAAVSTSRGAAFDKARRIVDIAMASLQSSVSRALLSVVVEGRKQHGDGKKDGISLQLRASIPMRRRSIKTFHTVLLSMGSGVISSVTMGKSVCRGLVLVGGCLLEQIQNCCGCGNDDAGSCWEEEWGTMDEKGDLVETCCNALAACASTFGALLPNNVRGTIDSIAQTCFSRLYSVGSSSLFAYSHVTRSLLQLGMNLVCVPWGDGGRGTLLAIVRSVALTLRNDPDDAVASKALSTLCALDAIVTPRAPALLTPPIRESPGDCANAMTATNIVERMKKASDDINAANNDTKQKKKRKTPDGEEHKNTLPTVNSPISGSTSMRNTSNNVTEREGIPNSFESAPTQHDDMIDPESTREYTNNLDKIDAVQDHAVQATANVQSDSNSIDEDDLNALIQKRERDLPPHEKIEEGENSADDSSMGDFPEIVDEGPDEEDRV